MNSKTFQSNDDRVKTLLFLVTGFPPDVSGVSHFNWERVVWLSQQGLYRVVVLAPDWQISEANRHYPETTPANLIIDCYPSKPWLPYPFTHVPTFAAAAYINHQLAFYQPDLVTVTDVERLFLLSTWRLPGKAYTQKHKIPFIAEYHTDLYNFSASYPGWQWLRSTVRFTQLSNYLYRQFDYTICASDAAQKSCIEMGISNTKVLPFLGIDVSNYSPTLRNRASLTPWLEEHEQDHVIFLFLGRLGYEKRVDILIQAFGQIKQLHPSCSLIIAGDGPDIVVRQLKQLAAAISDIHFIGFLLGSTKSKVLAACDVFCSPSPYETFGRTLVEAMAAGVPVVTVDSGAVAEHINHGVNGYLVPPNDVDSLAQMMEKILTTDQQQLIHQAYQDAQQFSLDRSCQSLVKFHQELLMNHQFF